MARSLKKEIIRWNHGAFLLFFVVYTWMVYSFMESYQQHETSTTACKFPTSPSDHYYYYNKRQIQQPNTNQNPDTQQLPQVARKIGPGVRGNAEPRAPKSVLDEEGHTDEAIEVVSSPQEVVAAVPKKTRSLDFDTSLSPDKDSAMTFGHALLAPGEENLFLYPVPAGVPAEHVWRYRSNGIYWNDMNDPLYQNFHQQVTEMRLRQGQGAIVPAVVQQHQRDVAQQLEEANLVRLAKLWNNAYPYTLEHTTFPLHDGTTYLITGDIELMWHRDSCAQVNHYLPLLAEEAAGASTAAAGTSGPPGRGSGGALEALVEGLVRRQSLFILADPYATSFRLFLDFDFAGKHKLTEWDYKSGRTIHVAMHNYELDNLAYHLRLSARLHQYSRSRRAFDDTWLQGLDRIMDTVKLEQRHDTDSLYVYPEIPNGGKGSKICYGDGLTWCSHRPSDDATKYGYLIPSNMMMVVSLRQAAQIVRDVKGGEERAVRAEQLAAAMDEGIHKHAVVHVDGIGQVYAYEVDACGNSELMDDANIPSLLSIPYLEYSSPTHDPDGVIRNNTRTFVLSQKNRHYYQSRDGKYRGIGSQHTARGNIWHLAIIMQALTTTSDDDDDELRQMMTTLLETATNDLMHESFSAQTPSRFTRKSFAWANSLFAELISTRLDDIIRVLTPPSPTTTKKEEETKPENNKQDTKPDNNKQDTKPETKEEAKPGNKAETKAEKREETRPKEIPKGRVRPA